MDGSPLIWVDGERAATLPLPDRGLDFGDGLFETILLHRGQPLLLDYHLQRLRAGLQALTFPDCLPTIQAQLQQVCSELSAQARMALRLTVTRGSAPRGYAAPEHATPRTVTVVSPLQYRDADLPAPLTLGWASLRWSEQPRLAGVKHLNRLEQVLAANEARALGVDEVVVLDAMGHVSSLSAANLFVLEDGRLLTPRVEGAGIAGTRRRLVLERLAPALGLAVEVADIQPRQLDRASELFCCNAIRGLQPIARLGQQTWQSFPVSEALHQQYRNAIAC